MHAWKFARILLTTFLLGALTHTTQAAAEQCCEVEESYEIGQFYEQGSCIDWCRGIKVHADFLYWKVVQDQMQYAAVFPNLIGLEAIIGGAGNVTTNANTPPDLLISQKILITEPSFKYRPGFRIGFGYEIPCSNWELQVDWTRIHEKKTSSVCDKNKGIFPLTFPIASVFGLTSISTAAISAIGLSNKAVSQWNFEFDTIDAQFLGNYSFSNCNTLAFHPFIGIKAASIEQKQKIKYFGFSISKQKIQAQVIKKNHFKGIGPNFGLDASWEFCPHYSLSTGLSAALLCGKFNVSETPSITIKPLEVEVIHKNSKKHRIRPMVDANVGLDWDTCICNHQVMFGLAYEVQYWWNQWQVPSSVTSSLLGSASPQGDLMMHGLTARAGFSF